MFIKNLKLIALFGLTTLVIGCASIGNEMLAEKSEQDIDAMIEQGVTTKAEIQELFGSPMEVNFTESGALTWSYWYAESTVTYGTLLVSMATAGISGTKSEGEQTQLVILFNDKDIVQRYDLSSRDYESRTNLYTNN